jgi:hypothetical protein
MKLLTQYYPFFQYNYSTIVFKKWLSEGTFETLKTPYRINSTTDNLKNKTLKVTKSE